MAISLTTHSIVPALLKRGEGEVALTVGQSLKIETSPGGEELLNAECPAGKTWLARVIVEITESNA